MVYDFASHLAINLSSKNSGRNFQEKTFRDTYANTRYTDLYSTNLCLGYRAGKEGGGMTKTLMMKDSGFFKELCDILEPENILCLGQLTFKCVYETLIGEKISSSLRCNKGLGERSSLRNADR